MSRNEADKKPEKVSDRLIGKKVVSWSEITHAASEATEKINRQLGLEIENPDKFSELRDSVEEAILRYLTKEQDFSLV